MVRATFQPGCKRRIADKHTSWLWCKALQCVLFCRLLGCLQNRSLDGGQRLPSQTVGLGVAASRLILLAPGVAQQIIAQPDDVLLHDGELVT
jgi:hypothetical protein